MKKCPDCARELDRMTIVCEYCGRLDQEHNKQSPKPLPKTSNSKESQDQKQ